MDETMRAMVLEQFGEPLALRTVPKPMPGKGEILVRIQASGVNPLDLKIRDGAGTHAQVKVPAILGIDLAGIVAAVGPGVADLAEGDEVFGMTGGVGSLQGSLAEYAVVDADLVARKPANLTMHEAAALPLAFITAWEGLVDRAQLTADQTLLVHGGAGGVGNICVQLGRARGARVFATGSPRDHELIASYGATPIDRARPVAEYVEEFTGGAAFDVVYDTVGGAVLDASFLAARYYGGHVVSALGWGTHSLAPLSFRAATYSGVYTLIPLLTGKGRAHHGAILREACALVEQGLIRPRVDQATFALAEANAAHDHHQAASGRGKVVVSVA
jgi:NADPH:quinone reductase-like Zn-dependent oxidoreductase